MVHSDTTLLKCRFPGQAFRSRHGCVECRRRRKRCNEGHPSCRACQERAAFCQYPTTAKESRVPNPTRFQSILPQPSLRSLSDSPIHLITHFQSNVALLISFPNSRIINPFSSHLLPLVNQSVAVCTAVEAISAAHLSNLDVMDPSYSPRIHLRALQVFSTEISQTADPESSVTAMIATILLFIYYEVVHGNSCWTALSHLRGAKAILEARPESIDGSPNSSITFLIDLLRYFDVMIALSIRQPRVCFNFDGVHGVPSCTSPSAEIDGILGLAKSLWPLLEDLADLLALKEAQGEGELPIIQVEDLEIRLHSWSADYMELRANESDEINREAMLQIAHSHRLSALLELYSAFPLLVPYRKKREVYQDALSSLLRVSALSVTMATLTWPLYTVSKVADNASDRSVLRHLFMKFADKRRMEIVQKAFMTMLDHWRQEGGENIDSAVFLA